MSISQIIQNRPGWEGTQPRIIQILSNDNFATVTSAGWLSEAQREGLYSPLPSDLLLVSYNSYTSPIVQLFTLTISNGIATLNPSGGDVVLPTVANHLMVSTDTSGTIGNLTGTAINDGSLQAGRSGVAGNLISYPAAAISGRIIVSSVANAGDFTVTISNVSFGQGSTISIPDPVNAAGRFLVGATATPFVSGEFPVASGTGGLMVSSGLAAANIQNKANVKAARTADIGGGGAGPISVVVAGVTAASIITGSIQSSTNPVSIQKITATGTGFDILFSGDPGASCFVNYVAFVVAQ